MEPSLLAALEALIVRNRGARFEADIFSALFQDPKTIRSFEFGKVDGAIDCLDDIAPTTSQASEDDANHLQEQLPSFAKRFWDLDEQFKIHPRSRRLVPFDVKSTVYNVPHKQIYATTLAQSETTAFYICICAADPRYVELIPNVRYIPLQEGEDPKRKRVQVNSTKKSTLDSSVFGFLNPCDAPYRMPVALLPEAIRRIRNCANGREDYINPWTNCRFTGWIPFTIQSAKPLKPDEDSEHFTAFLATMEMYRAVQIVASQGLPIDFDFVALQPRLADLKLILRRQRQVFIQHKIAELGTKLSDVTITRNGKGYFSLFDRFDFLAYQFEFMESAAATVKYLLFLPERYLPDEFYTTVEKRVDFGREEFKPYLIYMDIGGQWMKDVFTIIEGEQCPRRSGQRPVRAADIETHTSKRVWSGLRVWSLQSEVPQREISAPGVLSFSHQKWFYGILERCARESHGLIVALSPEHPMGDFAFCLYDWTEAERAAFFSSQTTPKTLHELPPATPLTTLYVFARDAEMTRQGPLLTSPQFRRVNSCVEHRLLMFDIMSSEVDTTTLGPVFFIPTQDMSPLEAHMSIHEENLSRNKNEKFSDRVPLVSEMLHSGRAVTDYVVGARGPLLYDKIGGASVIWKLLCSFAGRKPFQYPSTIERQPHEHHATVQRLNERLLEELNRAPVERLYHNLEDEVLADEVSNPM